MTAEQAATWYAAALERLNGLRGRFGFWGAPMPVQFCDGHGVHRADLQDLKQTLQQAWAGLHDFGEDGPPVGVRAEQAFIEAFCIIANAMRVEPEVFCGR